MSSRERDPSSSTSSEERPARDSMHSSPRLSLSGKPATVLVVEDDPELRDALVDMLNGNGYETLEASTGEEALAFVDPARGLDLILLDVNIPDPDGFEVLRHLASQRRLRDVPVICLSGRTGAADKIVALTLGAADYVTKPFDFEELDARMRRALRIKRTLERLSQDKRAAEELSLTDPLTGLPNRRALDERLEQEIERARRHDHHVGCLMIDIDRFKGINDQLGHSVGDAILREVGLALRSGLRSFDFVARSGGDEFVAILPGANLNGARAAARGLLEIVRTLQMTSAVVANLVPPTISIGIASYDGCETGQELLDRADEALLRAKRGGRDRSTSEAPKPG